MASSTAAHLILVSHMSLPFSDPREARTRALDRFFQQPPNWLRRTLQLVNHEEISEPQCAKSDNWVHDRLTNR